MVVTDNEGRRIAFEIADVEIQSIDGVDFSPIEDASLSPQEIGRYTEGGFLVAPNEDDILYGITWFQYHKNGDSLTNLTPVKLYTNQKDFFPCRVVKIYADDTSGKTTTATEIQVGFPV